MRANVTLAFNCQISATALGRLKTYSSAVCRRNSYVQFAHFGAVGGDDRDRTDDLRLAKPALSQLSYIPGNRDAAAAHYLTRAGGPG